MSVTKDDVRSHLGNKVRVHFAGEFKVGVLRFFTPKDYLVVADHRGDELNLAFEDLKSIEDARTPCACCGTLSNNVFQCDTELRCAECARAWASRQPTPREACSDCGQLGAVYSPKFKVWRCPRCHAKAGSFTGSTVEARVLTQAPCKTADKDSPLHDWKQFKSQWVCRACEVKVFGKPKFA